MQKNNSSEGKDDLRKKIRLVCIFPEQTKDDENIKNEVRNLLNLELQHQLIK